MISATAPMMASARKARPAIVSLWATSITYLRSRWWKRSRWVAVGAIRQAVESAVHISVAKKRFFWKSVTLLEALRERHREQEREQDLHAGQRDAELLE